MYKARALQLLLCVCTVALTSESFAGTFTGEFIGKFDNPVLSGNIIDTNGQLLPYDNTSTAVFSGMGTNSIEWGTFSGSASITHSTVTFIGNAVTDAVGNQQILLGALFFENGTSDEQTLIFGADLTISFNKGGVTPVVSHLSVVTTKNGDIDPFRDADFLGFSEFATTFNVFEGNNAWAFVYGSIQGDPYLQVEAIDLAPGTTGGFLGPLAVPEPSMGVLWSIALASTVFLRRRTAADSK
jgi:hypothetical protein